MARDKSPKQIFHLSTIGGYNVYWEIQCVSDPPVVHAIKYSNQILTKYSVMQFQLTINLVALVVAFVAAVTTGEMPLNVLQLLWVNLIMDALAALGTFLFPYSLSTLSSHTLNLDAPECAAAAVGQPHHGCPGSPR